MANKGRKVQIFGYMEFKKILGFRFAANLTLGLDDLSFVRPQRSRARP